MLALKFFIICQDVIIFQFFSNVALPRLEKIKNKRPLQKMLQRSEIHDIRFFYAKKKKLQSNEEFQRLVWFNAYIPMPFLYSNDEDLAKIKG